VDLFLNHLPKFVVADDAACGPTSEGFESLLLYDLVEQRSVGYLLLGGTRGEGLIEHVRCDEWIRHTIGVVTIA
jgi:hypothetical protein